MEPLTVETQRTGADDHQWPSENTETMAMIVITDQKEASDEQLWRFRVLLKQFSEWSCRDKAAAVRRFDHFFVDQFGWMADQNEAW